MGILNLVLKIIFSRMWPTFQIGPNFKVSTIESNENQRSSLGTR